VENWQQVLEYRKDTSFTYILRHRNDFFLIKVLSESYFVCTLLNVEFLYLVQGIS